MRSVAPRLTPLLLLLTLTAAGAAAAAGYGLTAPKRYRATAQLIVTPVPADDRAFTGIDVLRDSGGRRTAAASAAALLRSPLVADAVRAQLGLTRSRDSLLDALHVRIPGDGDVVDVTAEDTSANGAAQLANAFADALVNQRSARFQGQVSAAIARYERLAGASAADQAGISARLAELRLLAGEPDPTLQHAGQAPPPAAASWPDIRRLALAGAAAGAALGLLAALASLWRRRRRASGTAQYDRPVADEGALEKLVDRLEARLAAREAGLAARERDLQAKLDELRAAQAPAASGDAELRRRERELDERLAALAEHERQLAVAAATASGAASALARREQELERRVAAVQKRELATARRAAELGARERAEAPPPVPVPAPAPAPLPVEAPAPPAAPPSARPAPMLADGFNLIALENLVAEHEAEFPDRFDEWTSYLFFLREHASPGGVVPAQFDGLIAETFAELLPK